MVSDLDYPVIAFRQEGTSLESIENERFYVLADQAALTSVTRDELKSESYLRALLVDNSGAARVIGGVRDIGPITPLWHRVLLAVFNQAGAIRQRVEYEFVAHAPVAFADVQARVKASIARNQEDWIDDEAMAGENGEPAVLADLISAAMTAVDRSANLKELFENLKAAWPY